MRAENITKHEGSAFVLFRVLLLHHLPQDAIRRCDKYGETLETEAYYTTSWVRIFMKLFS